MVSGGGRKLTCAECAQLAEAFPDRAYPCADCPYPLAEENVQAWELFCEVTQRTRSKIEGREVDLFTVDWSLVRLLFEVRDYADREFLTRKLLALQRTLNSP